MKVFTYIAMLLTVAFSWSLDGYSVYKRSCSACHLEKVSPEKLASIRKIVKSGGKPPLKAPPMSEVSARVKKFYPTEEGFVRFVKDYITNPSREKGVCLPMAYKLFGVMPPVGRTLSEEEKEAVARWLYRNFKESWEEFIEKNPH
ncbi:MAG: c-type cytochrome [Aquificota bacterium]|nr:c-type cytochrome [Aquificota bacterium]